MVGSPDSLARLQAEVAEARRKVEAETAEKKRRERLAEAASEAKDADNAGAADTPGEAPSEDKAALS